MIGLLNNPGFYATYALFQAVVVLLLIRFLDPYEREPLWILALLALWGATGAAALSLVGNRAIRAALSPDARLVFGNAISAPVVEECAKGLALLAVIGPLGWMLARFGLGALDGLTDGIVYGAAVGLGFGFTEDFFYFVDEARLNGLNNGLHLFVYRRDFFGPAVLHHPLFTAAFGAGLGLATWSAKRLWRVVFPVLGLMLAILMHAVNNGLTQLVLVLKYGMDRTAEWARGDTVDPTGVQLDPAVDNTAGTLTSFLRVVDIWWFILFGAAVGLWVNYQRGVIKKELADEVGTGLLTHEEWTEMFRYWRRSKRYWSLLTSGQFEQWRHVRALHSALVHLALLKWKTRRFGGDWERVQRLRRQIATLAAFDPARGNLPEPPTPLVDREDELEALRAFVLEPDTPLITITGAGGTGKTRLALELARGFRDSFGSGVYFVSLASVTTADAAVGAIAGALGVADDERGALRATLASWLRDKELLLVLDSPEHVEGGSELVSELLASAERATLVAASQEPLRIQAERVFELAPLPTPAAGASEVADVSRSPSVALFVDRAKREDPAFALTPANAAAVAEICRRLDGLPLALELAAARVRALAPEEMLAQLDDPLRVLSRAGTDVPDRQRALRATIEWSVGLLDAPEQKLFARAAVFEDGWTLEAAEAVCGPDLGADVLDTLEGLVAKSVVRRERDAAGGTRFAMLATIRDYARERLGEGDELATLEERKAEFYRELVEAAEPALHGPDQAVWLRRLAAEEGNVRSVLEWSAASGRLELGLRVAGALPRFWSARGNMTEGRRWLDSALRRADGVPADVRAKAAFAAGYTALGQGDYADAKRYFDESVTRAREARDTQREAASLAQLGWIARAEGSPDEARTLAEQSLALAEQTGDRLTQSGALNVLGEAAGARGEHDEARALFDRSLALRRELGDRRLVANSLVTIGRSELVRGHHDAAKPVLEEALRIARELGDEWVTSVALGSLGVVRLNEGEHAEAGVLFSEALRTAHARGDRAVAAEALAGLAATDAALDRPERAVRLFSASTVLSDQVGTPSAVGHALEEQFVPALRTRLGEDSFTGLWSAGQALSTDEAVAAALGADEPSKPERGDAAEPAHAMG